MSAPWPAIPYEPWRETCSALHLYAQIVGKHRLARTPWVNHSWHATLYVNARGFTTSLIPDGPGGLEIGFDLLDHAVTGAATDGRRANFPLGPMSVAEFHGRFIDLVRSLGGTPDFHGRPNEVPAPIPFVDDRTERPYAADAVTRFFWATVAADRVLKRFRTAYLGKVSPVHLFWGSFDLAVTRFSGRLAPPKPEADVITREAYSHEASSVGWWPGDERLDHASFYSYAAPEPEGFRTARVQPAEAYYSEPLGGFYLPYDAVRTAADPSRMLLDFCQSTYVAAADLGKWDRAALER